MSEDHPDPQLLERFMRNQADSPERRTVVRHLLSGCVRCVAVTRRLWGLGETKSGFPELAGEEGAAYGRMLDDLSRRGSRREKRARSDRESAPRRLAELRELAPGERREKVASGRRFHTPAVCELLTGESRRAGEWAELAVEAAGHLDVRRFGALLVRSLQARAWGALGNARRRAGNLDGAEAALAAAAKALSEGADPLDRAELLDFQARLLADRERFDDAECMLGRALALYRTLGERHLEGQALLFAAAVRSRRGGGEWVREAIGRLREGLARLDEDRDPALAASAFHRLAGLLAENGHCEDAQAALWRARALYERLEDAPNLARLRLLEGILTETLGSPEVAEAAFREAMQESLQTGLAREAARALLGLALLYERQGRTADLARLAGELHSIIRVRDAGMSVTTALLFFRRLVETGYAKEDVLVEVARFLGEPPKVRRAGWGY
ncbi:MAG TPA: hypothetical protein VF173_33085 [Thermoanaerobaculia bacterium]|nr:hypothetical protein [Thermoanaerobaculia bacterium]